MKYKVYDISQELTHSQVYPGDMKPKLKKVKDMNKGDLYNLSTIHLCVHNGTHIDAPLHFIKGGASVDKININKFIGLCCVVSYDGLITGDVAVNLIENITNNYPEAGKKILLKGNAVVSNEAAVVFASCDLELLGTELLSIGDVNAPMEAHKTLLEKEVVLLEGIRLWGVTDGIYFLNCAPLSIEGSDGSPCRAILIKF